MSVDQENKTHIKSLIPPIIFLVLVIGISEFLIMQILPFFTELFPNVPEAVLDAVFLSIAIAPITLLIFKRNVSVLTFSQSSVKNKVLLAAGLPLTIAIVLILNGIIKGQEKIRPLNLLNNLIKINISTKDYIHELQNERGLTALYWGMRNSSTKKRLDIQKDKSDQTLDRLLDYLSAQEMQKAHSLFKQLSEQRYLLKSTRIKITHPDAKIQTILEDYTQYSKEVLELLLSLSDEIDNNELSIKHTAFTTLLQKEELIALERGIMTASFSLGRFSDNADSAILMEKWYRSVVSQQETYSKIFYSLLTDGETKHIENMLAVPEVTEIRQIREMILSDKTKRSLTKLKSLLGYNGMIHHFKNFILRGKEQNYRSVIVIHREISEIIEELKNQFSRNPVALNHISSIKYTIDEYLSKLPIIRQMIQDNKQIRQIDQVVSIDDSSAANAIIYLESNIWGIDSSYWYDLMGKKLDIMNKAGEFLTESLKTTGQKVVKDAAQQAYIFAAIALILVILVFALLIVVSRDISESFQAREKALKQANIAAKMKAEFLANMSHEIRTPINGVLGMLGLLIKTNLTAEQKHKARLAQSSASSLLNLINDILDFSKVEAGKIELEEIEFNLIDELSNLIESMAYSAQNKGLEIVFDTKNIDQTLVVGDSGRLRQVISNIISNAIKFTSKGEIVIKSNLIQNENNQLTFNCNISDTGIGIPDSKIDSLFDEFTQVDTSTTRQFGGTGLGLAISKNLCELMGGNIEVSSQLGHGTSFSISAIFKPSKNSKKVKPLIPLDKLNMLIINENSSGRKAMKRQLESWEVNVFECSQIRQSSELLEAHQGVLDSIIIDETESEPQMIKLLEEIRSKQGYKNTKIFLMTNIDHKHSENYFSDIKPDAHFPKPILMKDLFQLLVMNTQNTKPLELGIHIQQPQRQIAAETKVIDESNMQTTGIPILVVDDNPINQEVALGILEQLGFDSKKIDAASNGEEAISLMKDKEHYQLILMDCQMPIMDGYETSRNIRNGEANQRHRDVPIIAMTANAMKGDRDKCLNSGMNDYLTKPIDPDHLLELINRWGVNPTKQKLSKSSEEENMTEKIEQYPIWDKESALNRVRNNEPLLEKIIKLFKTQIPDLFDGLDKAVEQNDIPQIKHFAHTIKGVAANLSGLALQQVSEQLEQAAFDEKTELFSSLLLQVKESIEQLKQTMNNNS